MNRPEHQDLTPPNAEAGRIRLTGLKFSGRHGWFDAERKRDRTFTVDLEVSLSLEAASRSDALEDTLDYNALAETAGAIVTGESIRLIERLAGAIAESILAEHPVSAVEVTVHKPTPDVVGAPVEASVTLRRSRR